MALLGRIKTVPISALPLALYRLQWVLAERANELYGHTVYLNAC